jgi:hypothetical protein
VTDINDTQGPGLHVLHNHINVYGSVCPFTCSLPTVMSLVGHLLEEECIPFQGSVQHMCFPSEKPWCRGDSFNNT